MNQKGKILVVDDDRLVLATLTHGLSQAGYEVIDADNGDDAILLAREHKPELALLDIRMEGKTGFDVAAYLREYCQIPFMFLSAFADEATVAQVKELGALTYLIKPLDIQQIVPAVEAAFASKQQQQAAAAATQPVIDLKKSVQDEEPGVPASTSSAESHPDLAPLGDHLNNPVPMAVGIVMHRHSLGRRRALERLRQQASLENRSLEAVCERLLNAQEVLAGLGSL